MSELQQDLLISDELEVQNNKTTNEQGDEICVRVAFASSHNSDEAAHHPSLFSTHTDRPSVKSV